MRRLAAVLLASALAPALAPALAACSADEPAGATAEAPSDAGIRRDLLDVPDRGEASVRADLHLGIGTVAVGQAEPASLFQAEVTLPAGGLRTEFHTETTATESGPQASVRLGLAGKAASPGDLDRTRGLAWRLLFSHETPLDLALDLGAAEADLDLTGIPLRRLTLVCGVARAGLRLRAPNPEASADVRVRAGVSAFTGEGLGHLRFRRFRFEGGVGSFSLDFRGAPPEPGAEAALRVGVGELTVVLPAGVPLVLDAPGGRMSSVEIPPGLVTLGRGRYATPGAEADPSAFTVRITSGPARVRVRVE